MSNASTVLADAAFGHEPARWPLPSAFTAHDLWLRAVAAGGQGRYGSAVADLDALCRLSRRDPLESLACSTRASFLRQLGWHDQARGWDGRALAQAGGDTEAGTDALIGLAADALGVGRLAASAAALGHAGARLGGTPGRRLPVRLAWVSAELAMACGDGNTAVGHAERAVGLAAGLGSTRHTVKSEVVLAAARCSAGDVDAARRTADSALADADRAGLIPLCWALACLLVDIGSAAHEPPVVARIRNESAATVRRRGGNLADR